MAVIQLLYKGVGSRNTKAHLVASQGYFRLLWLLCVALTSCVNHMLMTHLCCSEFVVLYGWVARHTLHCNQWIAYTC